MQADDAGRTEATGSVSSLIDEITLIPEAGELKILLKGNLAAMLKMADQKKKRPSEPDGLLDQVQMVAGAGFEPATFGL